MIWTRREPFRRWRLLIRFSDQTDWYSSEVLDGLGQPADISPADQEEADLRARAVVDELRRQVNP